MITSEEYKILEQCVRFALVQGGPDTVLENCAKVLPVLQKIRLSVSDEKSEPGLKSV